MGTIIRITISLSIIIIAAYCIEDYPYGKLSILLIALFYGGLLYKNRRIWLFALPALIPISDMTLYSGRMFLSEIDIIFMVTLAILIFPKQSSQNNKPFALKIKLPELAIGLMAISYIISTAINLSYPTGTDANDFSSYQNPLNTFRVAKGFFWAMVLWPFLRNQYDTNPERTRNYFISGILTGVFLSGIGILWERGVLDDIFHWKGLYSIVYDLLNFSTTYRVTGLFSSMHVGGTAIDGYLIMVIPFCLYGFFSKKNINYTIITLICLLLGSYSIIVTFSRGLYAGFFVAMIFLAFAMYQRYASSPHYRPKNNTALIALYICFTISIIFLFKYGGYGATVGGVFLILATVFTVPFIQKTSKILSPVILGIIILIGSYIIYDSMIETKWTENNHFHALIAAVSTGFIFTGCTYFANKSLLPENYSIINEVKKAIIFSLISCIFWVGVIPPLLNSQVSVRFSTVTADFAHRMDNWRNSLNFREKNIVNRIFGTGVGSFPRYYFFDNYSKKTLVHYQYTKKKDVSFLSIGNGDFNITQKIPEYRPNKHYILRAKTKSKESKKYSISLKFCPKHILYSLMYQPNCISKIISGNAENHWQQHEITFNSGTIGQSGIFNWPVTLIIRNNRRNTIAYITDIQLLDAQGTNLISNGDFRKKSDRWIMIRDFSHDAWHAKNIFIHLIFEQGYFGLLAFILLLFIALLNQVKAMKQNDPLAPILIAAITGTLIVGIFGTIIDNPRITTLYFLLIFFGLLNTSQNNNSKTTG